MFKKPQNLKGLILNLIQGLFKQCSHIQIFLLFCRTKPYSTGRSQHNADFAKTNQNEVVRIRTNFFEDFRIRRLIRENEFVILNL